MENKQNSYKKEDDVLITSFGDSQLTILNVQKGAIDTIGVKGLEEKHEAITLVFTEDDLEPDLPVVFCIESVAQVDKLIAVLQKLRTQTWGLAVDFNNNKN
jgi:hypothetical protein